MRVSSPLARFSIVMVLFGAAGAGGCAKTIWIYQIPEFYTRDLETIAVVRFRNATRDRNAGKVIANSLANALMANGTYRVFNREDFKPLMDQRDLQIAFGSDPGAAASALRRIGKVQAILTGTVTAYGATSHSQRRREPVMYWDKRTESYRPTGQYRTYVITRNEANVAATAALIRVADGTTIHATPRAARGRRVSQGAPAPVDAYGCLAAAANDAVSQLLAEFAVFRRQIRISPRRDFRTASDIYDNEWAFTDTFKATDEKMFVVLRLPAVCDRNKFKLTIVRKSERRDLVSLDILWRRRFSVPRGEGFVFSPRQIARRGGGPGDYVVKFYSGPEPRMTRKFKIVP